MRWSVDGGRRVMAENNDCQQTLTITDLCPSFRRIHLLNLDLHGHFKEPHLGSPLCLLSGDKLPLPVVCS